MKSARQILEANGRFEPELTGSVHHYELILQEYKNTLAAMEEYAKQFKNTPASQGNVSGVQVKGLQEILDFIKEQKEICMNGYSESLDDEVIKSMYSGQNLAFGMVGKMIEKIITGYSSSKVKEDWVKIEEGCEMPDYDVYVLWLQENGNQIVEALDKDGNPWLFEKHGVLGEPTDKDEYIGNVVTHWCYLPSPPKSKQ